MKENNNQILVADARSKKMVDVKPLFDIEDMFGYKLAEEIIDEAIRHITIWTDPEFDLSRLNNLYVHLYIIRDMFKTISECNVPIIDK